MFFNKFPTTNYRFGDELGTTLFNNLSVYADIIDQLKDQITFYEKYTILDGDRPDITSQKLYGSRDYHWTFFLINDSLRESGWPMPERELRALVKGRYPHRTVTSESIFAHNFLPGTFVTGKTSGTTGKVVERNLDLGQIVIASDRNEAGLNNNFGQTEQIAAGTTALEQASNTIIATAESVQYDSVLHYKNSSGDIVDIDPYNQSTAGLTPTTIMEDHLDFNDNLKRIKVIKPNQIAAITNEFFQLLSE